MAEIGRLAEIGVGIAAPALADAQAWAIGLLDRLTAGIEGLDFGVDRRDGRRVDR